MLSEEPELLREPAGPGPERPPGIPAAWITAGLDAVIAYHKQRRDLYWACPSSEEVAAIIAAVVPLITAAAGEPS